MRLPLARTDGIVVQDMDDETLAYDLVTHQACCLNKAASIVYRACGDRMSLEDVRRIHGLTDDLVYLALDELRRANLLEETDPYISPFAGISRREIIKRAGLASFIGLPAIAAIVAPSAAAAASGGLLENNSRCTDAGQCQSGHCAPTSYLPVGRFCCAPGNGGTQPGRIETAAGVECFRSCASAGALCCSGTARSTSCGGDSFCASQQMFCCECT